jgi:hypothetical protein
MTRESEIYKSYQQDWNKFARDVLGVKLDPAQQDIVNSVQHNRRISVRSGTARGKDYVAAVSSICFLYLNYPSKVINTAPTGRQVESIMMPEISRLFKNAKYPLGGRLLKDGIYFTQDDTWYLMGFKADGDNVERWSGFHSPNLMTVVTEASGLSQQTYDAMEGILQGNSRLLLIFNPNRTSGEAYKSCRSPRYVKHKLSGLDAPNVVNYQRVIKGEISEVDYKKLHIPGQVDYEWIDDKVNHWCVEIPKDDYDPNNFDFIWNDKCYRPDKLFRVKVLGEFPLESDDTLIPLHWIEAANERWRQWQEQGWATKEPLRLGVDVAGMGRDNTCKCYRYGNYVSKINKLNILVDSTIHMKVAGSINSELGLNTSAALIDTIGEGAGVLSRLHELGVKRAISAKFSESANDLHDFTGIRKFVNMRSWCYWAVRDALDPANNVNLVLPPDDELTQELTETKYIIRSDGSYIIEPKEEIKKRINRSPDKADSLALSYYPYHNQSNIQDLTKIFQ